MGADVRGWASGLVPPAITQRLSRRHLSRFEDGFGDWAAAAAAAQGYDAPQILDQVAAATREVVAGRAAFERDGISFAERDYRWPVIASLLWQASRSGQHLRVLDLGGSLGSLYRQHLPLLRDVDVRWGVVEQAEFVAAGREFEDGRLGFHASLRECVEALQPNTVLLSSVLQYLSDVDATLAECLATDATMVVIDRTPVVPGSTDRFAVQHVPPAIYRASYPARLMGRDRLRSLFGSWTLAAEFPGLEPKMTSSSGAEIAWIGMTWVRHHD